MNGAPVTPTPDFKKPIHFNPLRPEQIDSHFIDNIFTHNLNVLIQILLKFVG